MIIRKINKAANVTFSATSECVDLKSLPRFLGIRARWGRLKYYVQLVIRINIHNT